MLLTVFHLCVDGGNPFNQCCTLYKDSFQCLDFVNNNMVSIPETKFLYPITLLFKYNC